MNQTNQPTAPQNPAPATLPPQPPTPTPPPTNVPPPSMGPKKESSGIGPIVAVIIIVILLAIGGIYYLMTETQMYAPVYDEALPTMEEVQNSNDPDVQAAMTQSSSDTIADIETDLDATDFSGIDAALGDLDAELAQ